MIRLVVRAVLLCAVLATGLVSVSAAQAAGMPDVQLGAKASGPLYGEAGDVTVTASLGDSQPKGYNLSFRVVLPKGITYGGGSAVAPQAISNAPVAGKTTLIFSNVSDLVANSQQALSFKVNHDQAEWEVGEPYDIEYEAFVNSDPRYIPAFDALGKAIPASSTGSSSATTSSKISAIEITKSEPSREGEILRGVHDNQTIYTLKLRNNLVRPTTATTIDDYLPAGLEFLGCADDEDNTTKAPTNSGGLDEYPGSGRIDIQDVDDCHAPRLVGTVDIDPDGDGPLSRGVYTHVQWATGDLAVGQVLTYRYRAAVPLTENTLEWSNGEPDTLSGKQAANLDNNSAGREISDEQELTNFARAEGSYKPLTGAAFEVDSEDSITRTAEDLAVYKSASSGTLSQGAITTWKLEFRTGEYRYSENIVVTDTLPDGLCPLGPVNYTEGGADAECAPVPGVNPSVPYKSVTENADGTFTIVWDSSVLDKLAHTDVNDTFAIEFPTRTRGSYQANFAPDTPILAKDGINNKVELTADAFSRCTSTGEPDCSVTGPIIYNSLGQPEKVVDASSAGQAAPSVVLNKEVAQNDENATNCSAATYVSTIPTYHPGDQVCWRLTIDFPANVDTKELRVTDFLPRNTVYVPGSAQDTSANTTTNELITNQSAAGLLHWDINGNYVPKGNQKFQVTIKTETVPTGIIKPVDIEGNLLKFAIENTPGQAFPLRDQADFQTDLPAVTIDKGVTRINSTAYTTNSPLRDGLTVKGGDVVTYQINVKSTHDTKNVQTWDRLPAEYDCSMVTAISDGGTCVDSGGSVRDLIKWNIPAISDGATKALSYKVGIPAIVGAGNTFTNNSGVRQYESTTNTGGTYTYVPQNNIDPAQTTPNVAKIDDPSNVVTRNPGTVKSRTTSIGETGNDINTQATIGETISYTLKTTLPAGTTFKTNPRIVDTPVSATTQPITVPATATLDGNPLPAGWSVSTVGQTVTVVIPDNYTVPTGADQLVEVKFSVRVTDVAGNERGKDLANRSAFTWT
ncbi:MAG: hypothetical protein M3Y23_01200, partial [Actinomycetota bacterium]|nr:hypothetical protein [Actinomycetota bacterium]